MNRALIIALSAIVALAAVLYWRLDVKTEQVAAISQQLDEQHRINNGLRESIRKQKELTKQVQELDRIATQELTNAQAENARLAAAVAAGTQRLRVQADCPRVPNTTGTTSMDDAGTAELPASARQDYHALRQQLTTTEAALAGLQEYVSGVCLSR